MRLVPLLALFALPLLAGETPQLERLVALLGDDDATRREAASRAVRKLLRAELAPLLEATRSADPEVRRAAVALLRGLAPRETEPPAEETSEAGWGRIINVQGNAVRFVVKGNGQFRLAQKPAGPAALLTDFGLDGLPADATLRAQLRLPAGRGFVVVSAVGEAKRRGLRAHDIVLRVDGKPVLEAPKIARLVGKKDAWKPVTIRVLRGGKIVDLR